MTYTSRMLQTHPRGSSDASLAEAIDALLACAQACTSCADACLGEDKVAELRRCITLNLDCADICAATASALSRQTEADAQTHRRLIEACIEACRRCGDECESHAQMHEHCKVCAEACRACAEKCQAVLQTAGV